MTVDRTCARMQYSGAMLGLPPYAASEWKPPLAKGSPATRGSLPDRGTFGRRVLVVEDNPADCHVGESCNARSDSATDRLVISCCCRMASMVRCHACGRAAALDLSREERRDAA